MQVSEQHTIYLLKLDIFYFTIKRFTKKSKNRKTVAFKFDFLKCLRFQHTLPIIITFRAELTKKTCYKRWREKSNDKKTKKILNIIGDNSIRF